jgi:hypothetical protein
MLRRDRRELKTENRPVRRSLGEGGKPKTENWKLETSVPP